MTTAMPQTLPAPTPALTAIAPDPIPTNPEVLYFVGVEVGDSIVLTYGTKQLLKLDLRYTDSWLDAPAPSTLVIELPLGWALVAEDENITWSGSAPIWVGQIITPLIEDIVDKSREPVASSFLLYHPKKDKKVDPVVIVRRDG